MDRSGLPALSTSPAHGQRDGARVAALALACVLWSACQQDSESNTSFADGGGEGCTPGAQQACPCAGGAPDGVQVCDASGASFGVCMGCPAGPGTEGGAETGVESSGGEVAESSSGDASATLTTSGADTSSDGGVMEPYVFEDCLIDTPRNGSEVCDDTGFTVPDDAPPNILVCLEATGGQIYIATNTAIDPTDGVMRCSGWELNGLNPWDELDYIAVVTCDAEQTTMAFDISAYAGQTLASIRSDTSEFSQTITPSRPRIQIEPAAPLFDATVLQPWHTSSLSEAAPRARARLGWADREAPRADERIAVLIFRASKAEEHDAARSRQTPRCSTLVGRTHAPTG